MKMSKREKVLLGILIFAVLGYVFYNFIYQPQQDRINELNDQITSNEAVLQEHLDAKQNISVITDENSQLEEELSEKLTKYLSKVDQEDIIIYIHETLKESEIDTPTLSFMDFEDYEHEASNQTDSDEAEPQLIDHSIMTVNVEFEGTYQKYLELVNRFWNFDQNILVSFVEIQSNEENGTDEITGNFDVQFIKVVDEFGNNDDFVNWNFDYDYLKENPLSKIPKNYFFNTNYEYLK
jgi:type IV pilus assembly protein PilO